MNRPQDNALQSHQRTDPVGADADAGVGFASTEEQTTRQLRAIDPGLAVITAALLRAVTAASPGGTPTLLYRFTRPDIQRGRNTGSS